MTLNFDENEERYQDITVIMDGKQYVGKFKACTIEHKANCLTIVDLSTYKLDLQEESTNE